VAVVGLAVAGRGRRFAASAAISGFVALPLLPAADLRGSAILALAPDQAETVGLAGIRPRCRRLQSIRPISETTL
jgi:hypothetical protein